jgi:Ca2+-transporting ATPase
MITSGAVGLYIAIANLSMIALGKNHYGSIAIGQSIGLVAFSLMLVVAAFEARSETETVFTVDTFNSSRMNLIALGEFAGAFLITQADFMRRLLGTVQLSARQWGLALLTAVVLLLGWEAGKWIARRRAHVGSPVGAG